jgi:hypothetical protein
MRLSMIPCSCHPSAFLICRTTRTSIHKCFLAWLTIQLSSKMYLYPLIISSLYKSSCLNTTWRCCIISRELCRGYRNYTDNYRTCRPTAPQYSIVGWQEIDNILSTKACKNKSIIQYWRNGNPIIKVVIPHKIFSKKTLNGTKPIKVEKAASMRPFRYIKRCECRYIHDPCKRAIKSVRPHAPIGRPPAW